jgi:tetratricopeptide (TPR) repeat protein
VNRLAFFIAGVVLLAGSSLFSFSTAAADRLSHAEARKLFTEANEFFRQANEVQSKDSDTARELYSKSVLRLERIIRDGNIVNGKLYYNIGNAYFRMDDLGRAIVNYLRASRFIPGDSNLNQNLDYARSRRLDKIEERQKTRVLKTILFWHYDLSYHVRVIIFAVFFIIFWLLLGVRIFKPEKFSRTWMVGTAAAAVLFLSSVFYEGLYQYSQRDGVIVAPKVIARKGDDQSYQPSFKDPLHSGTEFQLIEDRGDWYQVELRDGRHCWLPSSAVELV